MSSEMKLSMDIKLRWPGAIDNIIISDNLCTDAYMYNIMYIYVEYYYHNVIPI